MKNKQKKSNIKSITAKKIMQGLDEAIDWAKGKNVKVRVHNVTIPDVNIKKTRNKIGLSQEKFAEYFCIPASTLRNWEQGRRKPEGTARILLAIIEKHPQIVREILEENIL